MSLLRLEPVGSGLNSMKKVLGNMNPGKLGEQAVRLGRGCARRR